MDRLAGAEELLDGTLDDPAALAGNLRDLRRINRLLGGVRLSRLALAALAGGREAAGTSVLDVGTGGADIPVALMADARRHGRSLEIVGIDARPEVIAAARVVRPGIDRVAGLTLGVSDGRSLPYQDGAFDIAHASLVHHHLDPDDAVVLLREMARVARRGIVVNDLARARVHWLGARLIATLLTANRYTRYDAPLSVRRAYTRTEMRALLARAGLRPTAEFRGLLGHRFAIAAVRVTEA